MKMPKPVSNMAYKAGDPQQAGGGPPSPRIDSTTLMQGGRRLVIMHNGEEYFLQVTRAKRLILTK